MSTLTPNGNVILCVTRDGCTCGAPASTPSGMHHCDCPVHPGWCGAAWWLCRACVANGKDVVSRDNVTPIRRKPITLALPGEPALITIWEDGRIEFRDQEVLDEYVLERAQELTGERDR
jgi:hypothetical protein